MEAVAAAALSLRGVSKRFGAVQALQDASFDVAPGEIFGYLGPNGAGKTTTLRIVLGLVHADAGEARLLGAPSTRASSRERVGFLPGDLALHGDMRAGALLDYFARFRRGSPPVLRDRLLGALEVGRDVLDRRVKFLSHGTRQKLGLVIAMQHAPALILLDEPSTGLDPLVQQAFRGTLIELARDGAAVLFSSHVLSEVEQICGRVAILRAGRIVAVEAVHDLRARTLRRMRVRFPGDPPPALGETPGVLAVERSGDDWFLTMRGDVQPLLRRLADAGVAELAFPEAELEDVFLGYYGRQEHSADA